MPAASACFGMLHRASIRLEPVLPTILMFYSALQSRIVFHRSARSRWIGLGSSVSGSLKEARAAAELWRAVGRSNVDPIRERERRRRHAAKNLYLLREVAADAYESRKAELKGDGKAGRWVNPPRTAHPSQARQDACR